MEEQTARQLFLEDFQANVAAFLLFGFVFSAVVATIGAVLAARANALLGEARHLYWRMHEIEKTAGERSHQRHRWPALRNTQPRRKVARARTQRRAVR